jgi:hypothetical protein
MNWVALLLADPSPCLRWLVLTELLGRPATDSEAQETASLRSADPLAVGLLERQGPDGAWRGGDPTWAVQGHRGQATALALRRLGYLGFGPDHPAVQQGAEYLFSQQRKDGSWPLPESGDDETAHEGYSMIPLQTSLPLRGLAACGFATDPRAEQAYEWLLAQRLPDGSWPTGISSGNPGYVAGYRRLAHSRWGCRSNTTGALICLAHHPVRRTGPESRRALDLLLGRDTQEAYALGYEVARSIGLEPARGFITHYARFDLASVLDLCGRIGASAEDDRVAELVKFVRGLQSAYGLWEYAPHPQASRWLTFDLLRSFSRLRALADWTGLEPRTPFRAYAQRARRY